MVAPGGTPPQGVSEGIRSKGLAKAFVSSAGGFLLQAEEAITKSAAAPKVGA
jgi:hypothetical protein